MTILGAIIRPDRALVWTDTETYNLQCRPSGEFPKMAASPLGLVSAGAGMVALIRTAGSVVQTAMDIDEVERLMPGRLRSRAAEIAPDLAASAPAWFHANTLVAAGYSPTAGRMVGWSFDAGTFFEPALVGWLAQPRGMEMEDLLAQACGESDILRLARHQMAWQRNWGLEGATGRTLTIALVTQTSTHCWRIPDFDLSPLTPAPPNAVSDANPPQTDERPSEQRRAAS